MRRVIFTVLLLIFGLQTEGLSLQVILKPEDFGFTSERLDVMNIPPQSIMIDFSKDQTPNIRFIRYSFDTQLVGNRKVGKFFTKYHGISFISSQSLIGAPIISSVFSIYLSFWASRLDEGTVLARFYSIEDTGRSIEVFVRKSRIHISIKGIVVKPDGERKDVELISDETITPKNWYEISLVLDTINSRISFYINGIETDREIFKPASIELATTESVIEFFTEFFGYGESILVTPTFIRSVPKRTTKIPELISKVVDTKDPSTRIDKIILNGRGKFLIQCRISNNPYELLNNLVEWKDINEIKDKKGRYIQLKIIPVMDDEQNELESIEISTISDIPPQRPSILFAESRKNGEITVYWKNDIDDEIEYYEIYYGSSDRKYFGSEALNGASPIRVRKPSKFYPVLKYTIRGLANNKTYYFAIRSVRKDGSKSEYSEEVSAIPSISVSRNN